MSSSGDQAIPVGSIRPVAAVLTTPSRSTRYRAPSPTSSCSCRPVTPAKNRPARSQAPPHIRPDPSRSSRTLTSPSGVSPRKPLRAATSQPELVVRATAATGSTTGRTARSRTSPAASTRPHRTCPAVSTQSSSPAPSSHTGPAPCRAGRTGAGAASRTAGWGRPVDTSFDAMPFLPGCAGPTVSRASLNDGAGHRCTAGARAPATPPVPRRFLEQQPEQVERAVPVLGGGVAHLRVDDPERPGKRDAQAPEHLDEDVLGLLPERHVVGGTAQRIAQQPAELPGLLQPAEHAHLLLQPLGDGQVLGSDHVAAVPPGGIPAGDREVVDLLVDELPVPLDIVLVHIDVPRRAEEPLHLRDPCHVPSSSLVRHRVVARCSCTRRTAMEPSPTAEATRLTEPLRTSPAANTPGRLVSSSSGGGRGSSSAPVPTRASGPGTTQPTPAT